MGMKHFKAYTPSRRNKNLYLQRKRKMQEETHMVELLLDIKVEEIDKNIE